MPSISFSNVTAKLMVTLSAGLLAGCAVIRPVPLLEPVTVAAAGSLKDALTEISQEHQSRTGQKIQLTFAASGLLRQRIEQGEPFDVFASADMGHPQTLFEAGGWQAPRVFVRNQLCALTQAHLHLSPEQLLDALLDPKVRVGTSTPKADPAGDYAWALFRRAEIARPGAYAILNNKALPLTGSANSPKPPAGRGTYAWLMDEGQADLFLTYCTNAMAAQQEVPRLKVLAVPRELEVGAAYGVTLRNSSSPSAQAFAQTLFSPKAQTIFKRYGFGSP